jgi:hypothetical protein
LIGERKLTYNEFTSYIKPSISNKYKNEKFYIIPVEKINECRGYPYIYYLGSENKYSYFTFLGKVKCRDEITEFALPDSLCINKYPNSIDDENKRNRRAIIVDNKIVIE